MLATPIGARMVLRLGRSSSKQRVPHIADHDPSTHTVSRGAVEVVHGMLTVVGRAIRGIGADCHTDPAHLVLCNSAAQASAITYVDGSWTPSIRAYIQLPPRTAPRPIRAEWRPSRGLPG